MIKLYDVKWFYTDSGEVIPYIYNYNETKIKELLSRSIIDLPEDFRQISSLAGQVAITKIYGKTTKFYSSYDLLNEYLNPIQRAIILKGKFFNEAEVNEKQIKLMKHFIEQQIKRQKNKKTNQNQFDERDF